MQNKATNERAAARTTQRKSGRLFFSKGKIRNQRNKKNSGEQQIDDIERLRTRDHVAQPEKKSIGKSESMRTQGFCKRMSEDIHAPKFSW